MKKVFVALIVFCVIWISILIQNNFLNTVPLDGTVANIGVVIVVAIGLMCDKTIGGVVGLVYGCMLDVAIGKSFGIYLLAYMMLGYFSGKVGKGFSKDNKTTLVVMVGVATLIFEALVYFLGIIVYNYDLPMFTFIFTLIKEALYNVLLSVILFKPVLLLAEIINKSKNSYYLL